MRNYCTHRCIEHGVEHTSNRNDLYTSHSVIHNPIVSRGLATVRIDRGRETGEGEGVIEREIDRGRETVDR